jgi:hypothetical protein
MIDTDYVQLEKKKKVFTETEVSEDVDEFLHDCTITTIIHSVVKTERLSVVKTKTRDDLLKKPRVKIDRETS